MYKKGSWGVVDKVLDLMVLYQYVISTSQDVPVIVLLLHKNSMSHFDLDLNLTFSLHETCLGFICIYVCQYIAEA